MQLDATQQICLPETTPLEVEPIQATEGNQNVLTNFNLLGDDSEDEDPVLTGQ